jgi:ubiquinone/menaquinone biosynthesis C-methylase UbiE
MTNQFADVTELAGTEISAEQLQRMSHRYHWAAQFCRGGDVVEVACGSGQGLGILAATAKSVEAGDISAAILEGPRRHYSGRLTLTEFDAQALPFADASRDVLVLFEALYYVPDAERFAKECRRVLRPSGKVLIATANKDLSDFNASPCSYKYYGAKDLHELFQRHGFTVEVFGYMPVESISWRQKVLRPIKRFVVGAGHRLGHEAGKKLLKRLVFGRLVLMPAELPMDNAPFTPPVRLRPDAPDSVHKVIYACATLRG